MATTTTTTADSFSTSNIEKLEIETKAKDKSTADTTGSTINSDSKEENIAIQVEPNTGVSFPVKLDDGKDLITTGVREFIDNNQGGVGIKIYGIGMYAEVKKLKELMIVKIGNEAPTKPTNEMYQALIDSDVGMTLKLVFIRPKITMINVKKAIVSELEPSIKMFNNGSKDDELTNKMFAEVSDSLILVPGSVVEISKLPGYFLQTKVKDVVVSKIESELLCKAYFNMYFGQDSKDKDAKERFGMYLLSLF